MAVQAAKNERRRAALTRAVVPYAVRIGIILLGKPIDNAIDSEIRGAEEVFITIGAVIITVSHSEVAVIFVVSGLTFFAVERDFVREDVHIENNKSALRKPLFRADARTGSGNVDDCWIGSFTLLGNAQIAIYAAVVYGSKIDGEDVNFVVAERIDFRLLEVKRQRAHFGFTLVPEFVEIVRFGKARLNLFRVKRRACERRLGGFFVD